MQLKSIGITIWIYTTWLIIFLLFLPPCLLLSLFPASFRYKNRFYFWLTSWWTYLLVRLACIDVYVTGSDRLPSYPDSPAVIVMNHTSALDIVLVELVVGSYPHVWLVKTAYGKMPFLGFLMKRMHVLVDRLRPRKSAESLAKAYRIACDISTHLLIFPEGTRCTDGKLGPFLEGFALLAKKLQRPVIPIAIEGAHMILPARKFLLSPRATKIKITIGMPMIMQEKETRSAFTKRVYAWFEKRLRKDGYTKCI